VKNRRQWLATAGALLSVATLATKGQEPDPFAGLLALPLPLENRWQTDYRGVLRLGANAVSDDNFMFGQYSGLQGGGVTAVGALAFDDWGEEGGWSLDLQNLGLDTREGTLRWIRRERLQIEIGFDHQLQVRNDSGRTPFRGDSELTLPGNWVGGVTTRDFDALDGALRAFSRELRRENTFARLAFAVNEHLTINTGYRYQQRQGRRDLGAGIYVDAASADAVLLPFPIDYEDTTVDFGFAYSGDALTLQGSVEHSRFSSDDAALSWQNPYSNYSPVVRYPDGLGAVAQPPDNELLSGRLSGVWRLGRKWVVDFKGSLARAEQNDAFLPYTVNPVGAEAAPLPAPRLDGRHTTATGEGTLRWRPAGRLSADFRIYARDRDYDIPRLPFNYVRGDAGFRPDTAFTVYSTAYGRLAQGTETRLRLRLPGHSKLELAYAYERVERRNTAVEQTDEDRYELVYRLRPVEALTARLELDFVDVAAGTYRWDQSYFARLDSALINATPEGQRYTNHPLLTQFHLGNREEVGARLRLDYRFSPRLTAGARLEWRSTDFDATQLGLTGRHLWRSTADLSLALPDEQHLTAYVSHDSIRSRQGGRAFRGGIEKEAFATAEPLPQASDPARDWTQESDDRVLVLGMNWHYPITARTTLDVDYTFTDTRAIQGFLAAPRGLSLDDLPDVDTRTHHLRSSLLWSLRPEFGVRLDYEYYAHDNSDWAWAGLSPNSLDKVLTFGQRNANEGVHYLGASVVYRLR
jgi:MtrB/PioB family decaheme-associated outer membrane protein